MFPWGGEINYEGTTLIPSLWNSFNFFDVRRRRRSLSLSLRVPFLRRLRAVNPRLLYEKRQSLRWASARPSGRSLFLHPAWIIYRSGRCQTFQGRLQFRAKPGAVIQERPWASWGGPSLLRLSNLLATNPPGCGDTRSLPPPFSDSFVWLALGGIVGKQRGVFH